MRRIILVMLLAVVSSSAAAEWVGVGGNETDTTTTYFDPATIRKAGNIVRMWSLIDYKAPYVISRKALMSQRMQYEYDCEEERMRRLYLSMHTGNMATGEAAILDSDPGKWEPIPPQSIGEGLWKIACGRR